MSAADVFALLDPPLWAVTAQDGSRRGGLIATFVSNASIVPELPRVLVGVARSHHTWELIETSGAFALHLLGDDQLDWVERLGLRSGRDGDKLDGMAHERGPTGAPLLADALGWLDCRVEDRLDTGDRTVYLAAVVEGRRLREGMPLTVSAMLRRAPDEWRRELKEQMAHDAALDAAAIRAWRLSRNLS
jgi:flavin reductase (DIM6/NTAB) family NADH-FMN oxidoreductase RutF